MLVTIHDFDPFFVLVVWLVFILIVNHIILSVSLTQGLLKFEA